MKFYFFSYGMCCNPNIMARHDYCKPIGKATLPGYHLIFRFHASIERGDQVDGVLWEIDEDTLHRLDEQEGCPSYYIRKVLPVTCNGETYDAVVYIMSYTISCSTIGVEPNKHYLEMIEEGYSAFGIDHDQISKALRETLEKNYEVK
jgi:gamma-glutamylcyclotransferase (GGCT)/AIG2-like uncharacterized protein YtfP